jgi:hypothetical protein
MAGTAKPRSRKQKATRPRTSRRQPTIRRDRQDLGQGPVGRFGAPAASQASGGVSASLVTSVRVRAMVLTSPLGGGVPPAPRLRAGVAVDGRGHRPNRRRTGLSGSIDTSQCLHTAACQESRAPLDTFRGQGRVGDGGDRPVPVK